MSSAIYKPFKISEEMNGSGVTEKEMLIRS